MAVLACGFNHRNVVLSDREQCALPQEQWPDALASLRAEKTVQEAVILSTCNRTELYTITETPELVADWFLATSPVVAKRISKHFYCYEAEAAIRHLMRLASGLDSMVIGEPQIFGQVKKAYDIANSVGAVGTQFKQLFPAVFAVGKQVRNQTAVGERAVSLAYAVCQLVRQLFSDLSGRRILCVGAGETIDLMLTHLSQQKMQHIQVVNRNLSRAEELAARFGCYACPWDSLPCAMAQADIVITATGSLQPVIMQDMLQHANREDNNPLFIADLAVPRDVEVCIGDLPGVYLYNLDDMQKVLEKNQQHRQSAAKEAEEIVQQEALRYLRSRKVSSAGSLINEFRSSAEAMRDSCLSRAQAQIASGADPQLVLDRFAHELTNKLIHQPTIYLREAASQEEQQQQSALRNFFASEPVCLDTC